MRRIASTARPATSRIPSRTSAGSFPKAAAARIIRTCSSCYDGFPARKEAAMKTVSDLLKVKPHRLVTVRPDQTVLEAIKVLAEHDIGAAIVMDGAKLAGIFSERDYTRKVILQGRASNSTSVREIMTAKVISVTPRTGTR